MTLVAQPEEITDPFDELDPREFIIIKNANVNNLQNLSVALPRGKFIVITGVSGSGKSSLAFDTLFAEGQRMYVESLSSYARQFLGRMEKPDVEYIKGVSPAIAVEQKVNTRNTRSTVGTSTEIYDYLKLLFARIGRTFSPISGEEVQKDTVTSVVDTILSQAEGTKFMILAELQRKAERATEEELRVLLQQGFTRVQVGEDVFFVEELLEKPEGLTETSKINILIDRNSVKHNDEAEQFRLADSVQTAFFEGHGTCQVVFYPKSGEKEIQEFSDRFELDGMRFEEPSVNFFSFNNPYGACRRCEGFGTILGIDPKLVIPDPSLSVYEGVIHPWNGDKMKQIWLKPLLLQSGKFDFPIHRPYEELTTAQQKLLWTGNEYFDGLNAFFDDLQSQRHKIQYRVMLSRYRGRQLCPECHGSRLRKDASYVKIQGKSITDLVLMPIKDVRQFFDTLELTTFEAGVSRLLLLEIQNRLRYLSEVGLNYLTLNRLTASLSGGEFQRIKLATSLGSALVGSMYILDEPSIGLHPRDTQNLIRVLKELRDLGNTLIVVEHEEEVMEAADQIIDIGPEAGSYGGKLIFQGTPQEIRESAESKTGQFLSGTATVALPERRRKWSESIQVLGASHHNLKEFDVDFPLQVLTVVTGVSGSGKSTLVRQVLYPALQRSLGVAENDEATGTFRKLAGNIGRLSAVELIDQNPIGKSSRSNPVTYVKAYDAIRKLFSEQPEAKRMGLTPKFFSFNVEGGRCETCQGEGQTKIEMQFMADILLTCEDCKGKRFKEDVLEVKVNDKDIDQVLQMTVDEAILFFKDTKAILKKLLPLQEVGLGYVGLGQSSSTLSGGEAQRVKLASYLSKGGNSKDHILFIFDEPTTGLHFHDISKLLKSIQALIEQGHSVIIIEHNLEVIKSADWVIDLGPEGGEEGGHLCFAGTPEALTELEDNHTATFLRGKVSSS